MYHSLKNKHTGLGIALGMLLFLLQYLIVCVDTNKAKIPGLKAILWIILCISIPE